MITKTLPYKGSLLLKVLSMLEGTLTGDITRYQTSFLKYIVLTDGLQEMRYSTEVIKSSFSVLPH